MKNSILISIILIVTILSLIIVFYFTYLSNEQDGTSKWSGTPEGMIGINFDKCEKTEGSNIVYDETPVCYLPDGTSYKIDE